MSENEEILDDLIEMLKFMKLRNNTYDSPLKKKLYNEDIDKTVSVLETVKSMDNRKKRKQNTVTVKNDANVSTLDLQPIIKQLERLDQHIGAINKKIDSIIPQDVAQEKNTETKPLDTAKAGVQEQEKTELEILDAVEEQSEQLKTKNSEKQGNLGAKENETQPIQNDEFWDESVDRENTIEPKLSRHMEEIVTQYNQNDKKFIRADKLGLIKDEEERYAQMPKPFTSLAESQALTLEKKQGNGPFVAVLDEDNIYFMLPKKKLLRSASEIKKSAVEKFFTVNSPDDLQGKYSQIFLLKPAVIEKNAEGRYHLKELGLIDVK